MKNIISFCLKIILNIILVYIIILLFPISVLSQKIYSVEEAESIFYPISDDYKMQIKNAIPKIASVQPDQQKKLLVFNLHVSKDRKPLVGHYSIPYANYAILLMGETTGAYETFFSNDTLVFQPQILDQFDAICFNNTGGVLFDDDELRMNILDYVYGGKGFIGIHAAAATFVQWPVYDQFPAFGIMLGGYENGGHPWKENEWITIRVDEPDHPVNKTIGYHSFEISDEVFQFSEPYSRDLVRVLMSIDISKTDTSYNRRILPERRADWDLAMSWIKSYGRGRVYYSSFGDNPHINWDTRILNHYLAGIQFVLGDLKAPTTPNNLLTPANRALEKSGWTFGLAAYTYKDQTLMETIEQANTLGLKHLEAYFNQNVSTDIQKQFGAELSHDELLIIRDKLIQTGTYITNYYIHDFPSSDAGCKKLFDFGRKMGITTFVSVPNPKDLDLIEKYCKEYNIRLAIYNYDKKLSPRYWQPEGILKVCDGRSSLIGASGDIGYWIRSGINPIEAIEKLDDRLMLLHIHDLDRLDKDGQDVAWGEGKVDLKSILQAIETKSYSDMAIILEYAYNGSKSFPEILKSIDFFNRWIVDNTRDQD